MTDSLSVAYPPFGLRITHADMTLRVLRDEDMPEYLDLLSGPIFADESVDWAFPWHQVPVEQRRRSALQAHWAWRGSLRPEAWCLSFGVYIDGVLVGIQDVMAEDFQRRRVVSSGSWLGLKYQGRGWGVRMRKLMLHFAFDHLGAVKAESDAVVGNEASLGVSRSAGYELDGTRITISGDRTVKMQWVGVTPETFHRLEGDVTVTGFTDELKQLLGVETK